MTLVFDKIENFFAENYRKSQKIVIITSTPGHPVHGERVRTRPNAPRGLRCFDARKLIGGGMPGGEIFAHGARASEPANKQK
jgi:hypothetical protein